MNLGFLKNNKGFSLIECIISIAIFAVMSIIVFQILSNALRQRELNDAAIEKKNEQIAENVKGKNEPAETLPIVVEFFKLGPDGNPDGSPPIGIDGALSKYDDEESIYSITKPSLDLSEYEYNLLAAKGHIIASGRAFYSTVLFNEVHIAQAVFTDDKGTADISDDRSMMTWTMTLKYDEAALADGFVMYFKIPSNAVTDMETDGNALVRSIFYGGETYVRARTLNASSEQAVLKIEMDMTDAGVYTGLKTWFDSSVISGGDAVYLVPDAFNTNNYMTS